MKKIVNLLIVICTVLFITACGDPIPIQEMTDAKSNITKAESVKAQKYAKEEYDESISLIKKCHVQLKDEKFEEASKTAKTSSEKAIEAYNKALPLLAKDSIEIAEDSLAGAEEAYSSELASSEYMEASKELEKAKSLFEQKKYYPAYEAALIADSKAKAARNTAISKKSMLQDAIDEVKTILTNAEKYNASAITPEKYSEAEMNLETAEKSLENLELKKGFEAVGVAKAAADEAYLEAIKSTALTNIENAEAAVKEAESSNGASIAEDELNGARELLSTSKSQFDETLYLEAMNSADESMRLSTVVVKQGEAADANNAKPDSTEPKVEEKKPEKDYFYYTVKSYESKHKDCLWVLAKRFYGNPRKWKVIYNANKDVIKDPNLIRPGWKLKIPKQKK